MSCRHTTPIDLDNVQLLANGARKYVGFDAYCKTKMANVLMAWEIQRRYSSVGITANAVHPGTIIQSGFWRQQVRIGRHASELLPHPINGGVALI
jgi:WW domain-containing oxidoreductase